MCDEWKIASLCFYRNVSVSKQETLHLYTYMDNSIASAMVFCEYKSQIASTQIVPDIAWPGAHEGL